MSLNLRSRLILLLVAELIAGLIWYLTVSAHHPAPASAFIALSQVSVPEMPARAAAWVQAAPPLRREAAAIETLAAVVTMTRPGAMPYVVSAICRRQPEVTGAVVSHAIQLQPDYELAFCRAAVCAAPERVESVVMAACSVNPTNFPDVALEVYQRVPQYQQLILAGLTNALPYVAPCLEQALGEVAPGDFTALLNQTVQHVNEAAQKLNGKK